ncbi:MAG TPA: Na-translocating system protein MpsC family protein, partial [Solirubrobacteraceae bacterium]
IVRIMRDFYGKGAARSRTMIFDEYVFVILDDVLTTAEMTLRNGGAGELVRKVRMTFEDVMTAAFVGEVERLTGRTVVAYHSQVVLEPPGCFEIFVLDPTQEGLGAPVQAGKPVEAAELQEPGQVGDVDQLPSPGERPAPDGGTETDAAHRSDAAARAAISNAVMRLTNELYGRGAARTRTFITDEHVFCAMEGVLTTVERTLVEAGETELVRELRTRFMQMVRPMFAAEVARLAGRRVLALESQLVFDPDTLFLIFVLGDGRAPEPAAAGGEIAEANGL